MPYWTTLVRFNRFISLAEIFIHLNQCEIEISVNRQHGGFVPILWQEQHERRGPFRDTYGKLGRKTTVFSIKCECNFSKNLTCISFRLNVMPVTCGFTWFVSGTQACSRSSCALAASKAPPTPPSLLPYIGWPASTTMDKRTTVSDITTVLFFF